MIPSRRWFPGTLAERAMWYNNFATQLAAVYASLGLLAADFAIISGDNQAIQFLKDTMATLDAYADGIRQYRITLTEHPIGEATPGFPADPAFSVPVSIPPVTTGIFERLDDMVRRIKAAPAYTDEIGALLGIIGSTPVVVPDADLKPVIRASESFTGYQFTVNVTRLGMTSFKVQAQRAGQMTWDDVAFGTTNPATVTVKSTVSGQPERIFVRAILLDKNEPVGIPSDPTYVTVNP